MRASAHWLTAAGFTSSQNYSTVRTPGKYSLGSNAHNDDRDSNGPGELVFEKRSMLCGKDAATADDKSFEVVHLPKTAIKCRR